MPLGPSARTATQAATVNADTLYFEDPHSWKKSILQQFYEENPDLFKIQVSHKLRSADQFAGEGLMAHLAIQQKRAIFDNRYKTLQLKPGEQSIRRVKAKLAAADADDRFLFACVQSLERS